MFADQHMRQPVLVAAEQRQGVAKIIAHALAPAGDGAVQRSGGVASEAADEVGDAIGGGFVVLGAADILQRRAVGAMHDMDARFVESDPLQPVVAAESVKMAARAMQQRQRRAPSRVVIR